MKWLGWGLLLTLLAVAAALLAQFNDGNVVLLLPPTRIDLSLNSFLLLAAFVLVTVWWLARLAQRASDFPDRVRAYRHRRDEAGSQRALRARAQRRAQVAAAGQVLVHPNGAVDLAAAAEQVA
jgi:HemY protein